MTLEELQAEQRRYDERYWEINKPPREKLGHVNAHAAKTLGKVAAVYERHAHEVQRAGQDIPLGNAEVLWEEAAPDLCMHALQVADLRGMTLRSLYRALLGRRVGPATLLDLQDMQAVFDERNWVEKTDKGKLEDIVLDLEDALGVFAQWLRGDESVFADEIELGLMRGALRIANLGKRDLDQLYHDRLARNVRKLKRRAS